MTRHRIAAALLAIQALAPLTAAQGLAPERVVAALPAVEAYLEGLRERSGVPGLAVAIVHEDRAVFVRGFGVRVAGEPAAVDADTVFPLASLSKPLTATVIAGLVGDGTVGWDTRIADLDPAFRLAGDFEAAEVTIRDLLCHRAGLPDHAGDVLEDLGYSRAEVLRRLRFLPLATPFRAGYAYTNFGFTEAAVAAARPTGRAWEDLAADRLLRPLGMGRTSYRHADLAAAENRARLHVRVDGRWVAKFDRRADAQAPAGGASSTATDLARWLRLVLAGGSLDGRRQIAADALGETQRPQVVNRPASSPSDHTGFYGLGWNVGQDAAGRLTLGHSGAFDLGAATCVQLIPADRLGIVVLTNAAPIGVAEAAVFGSLDVIRDGAPGRDWLATLAPAFERMATPAYGLRVDYAAPPADATPALPAATYAGIYRNDFVGEAVVAAEAGGLVLRLGPGPRSYPLRHYDRDTFHYQPEGELAAGPSGVTFRIGPDRIADAVTIENLDLHGSGTLHRIAPGR